MTRAPSTWHATPSLCHILHLWERFKGPNALGYGGAALGASMAGRIFRDTHARYLARHAHFKSHPAVVRMHPESLF